MTAVDEWDIRRTLRRIEDKIDAQSALLTQLYALLTGRGVPDDLKILISKGEDMPPITRHVKMGPAKGSPKKLAGAPFHIPPGTTALVIILDPIDATGADVTPTPDMVGTLTDSLTPTGVVAGADTFHYTETIPAGTPASTQITLTGGLTSNLTPPAFQPLSATDVLITPPVPLPADLKITVSIGP